MAKTRSRYIEDLKVRMVEWEAKLKTIENPPDYYYWFIKDPPEEKLPKRGEIWEWTWTWACGTPETIRYEVLRISGKHYPRMVLMDIETKGITKLLCRSAPGEWCKISSTP